MRGFGSFDDDGVIVSPRRRAAWIVAIRAGQAENDAMGASRAGNLGRGRVTLPGNIGLPGQATVEIRTIFMPAGPFRLSPLQIKTNKSIDFVGGGEYIESRRNRMNKPFYFVISNHGNGDIVFRGDLRSCKLWIMEEGSKNYPMSYYVIAELTEN